MTELKITSPKLFCFVLMPFDEEFYDVYELGIKASCEEAGAYCERLDEQIFQETMLDRIYNQIAKADLIIADMTKRNPNVFYEVGYAHALNKPTILLTRNSVDIPFDLKHFSHIIYGEKITTLKEELTTRVQWFVENPIEKGSQSGVGIEIFLDEQNLSSGEVVFDWAIMVGGIFPKITLFNSSPRTFEPGAFKVGIITNSLYSVLENYPNPDVVSIDQSATTKLPNSNLLHMLPDFPRLFPQLSTSYQISLKRNFGEEFPMKIGSEEQIILRVFTDSGTRDYPLIIRLVDKITE